MKILVGITLVVSIYLIFWGPRKASLSVTAALFLMLLCVSVCVFNVFTTELSLLPYHGEFQSHGRDELVWNKLAVLTAQTAPALGYKLKQKQPYLHISACSPWNTIRSASIFNIQQTERLPSFPVSSQAIPQTASCSFRCYRTQPWLFDLIRDTPYGAAQQGKVLSGTNVYLFLFLLGGPKLKRVSLLPPIAHQWFMVLFCHMDKNANEPPITNKCGLIVFPHLQKWLEIRKKLEETCQGIHFWQDCMKCTSFYRLPFFRGIVQSTAQFGLRSLAGLFSYQTGFKCSSIYNTMQ